MTSVALFISMMISICAMYWGYVQAEYEIASRWILGIGVIWFFAQWQRWNWFSSVVLFAFVLFSAFGLMFGFEFHWMLTGSVFALFAWDMTDFRHRLHLAVEDDDSRGLERRHLARLSLLTLAALLLVSLALYTQVQFTFEWGVFLVVVIVVGLIQLVGWFRKQGK